MTKTYLNPTKVHLKEIHSWLIKEDTEYNQGFLCNWGLIQNAFYKNKLIIIAVHDLAIGFMAFEVCGLVAKIDIIEIKPDERKKGYANILIDSFMEYVKNKELLVCELFCQPEDSECFWKHVGFEKFPSISYFKKIYMYKPLINTLKPIKKPKTTNNITLWNCEPYLADRIPPLCYWDIIFEDDNSTLINPIIFPVSLDWQIELRINGKSLITNKIKRFPYILENCNNFMIIKNIPIKNQYESHIN